MNVVRILAEGTYRNQWDGADETVRVFVVEWNEGFDWQSGAHATVVLLEPMTMRGALLPAGTLTNVIARLEDEVMLTVDPTTFVGRSAA